MGLRFIYGRAGSGKSRYCLEEIKARIKSGKESPCILLVPEQFSLQAERNLARVLGTVAGAGMETGMEAGAGAGAGSATGTGTVAVPGTSGIIKAEVLSFKRMAYKVFSEVGGITRTRLNMAGKCMIIHKILENMEDEGNILQSFAGRQGFVKTISEMIAEFKKCGIKPEDLEHASRADIMNQKNNSLLKNKLEGLARVYREYENIISEKYMDMDDDLEILKEKLDKTSMFDGAEVWIDEFSGFTHQEYQVIEKLMRKAYRVNVSLCTDCLFDEGMDYNAQGNTGNGIHGAIHGGAHDGTGNSIHGAMHGAIHGSTCGGIDYTDIFSPVKIVVRKLVQMAREAGIPIESPVVLPVSNRLHRFKDSAELEHLEKYFFTFPFKRYEVKDDDRETPGKISENISRKINENISRETKESINRETRGKTKDISIFTASNIYTEIEDTAIDIIRLCRDKGLRYRDIAIVCGNPAVYEKFIKAVFAQYEIPCFIDRKKDVIGHPLVQLIISVFEIFMYNWSYEAVFRYLKTGLTGIPAEDIDLLENYVLECGIRGNRWTREEDWDYIPEMTWEDEKDEKYKDLLARVNDTRKRVVNPLLGFHARAVGRKTAREICEALFDLLCVLDVPSQIGRYIEMFKEEGELLLASEYRQIWNITMEILDQIVELMGSERAGLKRFLEILKIGFGEHKTGLIPPSLDQVVILDMERSKIHEVDALYVLGANDGIFPLPALDESILSDREREVLQVLDMELAGSARVKAFESQYLVYSVLTAARKYLRISVPIADQGGGTLRPSIIISRLKRIFPGILETGNITPGMSTARPAGHAGSTGITSIGGGSCGTGSTDRTGRTDRTGSTAGTGKTGDADKTSDTAGTGNETYDPGLVSNRIQAFNGLISTMRKAADGQDVNPVWKDVYIWFMNNEKWRERCMAIHSALAYTNLAGPIETEKAGKLYGRSLYSSVTRLEKYASCPFAYYVQYGLRAKERKVISLDPPDIGTFLHKAIEEFSRHVTERGLSWRDIDKDWCARTIGEISDRLLENARGGPIKNGPRRCRIIVKRLDRVLFRAAWLIVEHIKRSGFEPVGCELDFGSEQGLPPICIKLPTGDTMKLTGRIDRVDAFTTGDKTYIRIIDYKSGSKGFDLSDVFYGTGIQLVTYLSALLNEEKTARKVIGEKLETPVLPGGILYFKVDDPIIRSSNELTAEEAEKEIMKKLKMKGLVLADVDVVKEMDRTIEGDSLFIPVRINKGDTLGKVSSVATGEQFAILCRYVEKILENLGTAILKGDISISPCKNQKMTSCQYCRYTSVCQFDLGLKNNRYRILSEKSNEEIWELMKSACNGGNGGVAGEQHD